MTKLIKNRRLRRFQLWLYRRYRENKIFLIGIAIGALVISTAYYSMFYILYFKLNYEDTESAGQFGDMFGSVNSFFSACAFMVIAISLLLQKNELSLQRKQLKLQRKDLIMSRDLQQAEMTAQRAEMRLTRELHAKSNFESKLMFLLQNLERQIILVQGNFVKQGAKHGTIELSGNKYFGQLYKEIGTIIRFSTVGGGAVEKVEDNYDTHAIFSFYGLLGNKDYWLLRSTEHYEDFNNVTFNRMHEVRKEEYFNSWLTYRAIIKVLENEYRYWKSKGFGTQKEMDIFFETYAELIKSAIPLTARMIYLYLNVLPPQQIPDVYITRKMYDDVETADFFNILHKEVFLRQRM